MQDIAVGDFAQSDRRSKAAEHADSSRRSRYRRTSSTAGIGNEGIKWQLLRDPVLGPEGCSLFENMDALQQDPRYKESIPFPLS